MKKILILVSSLTLIFTQANAINDGDLKSKMKEFFYESCLQEMVESFFGTDFEIEKMEDGDEAILEGIDQYCSCAGEKVIGGLSLEELEILADSGSAGANESEIEVLDKKVDKVTKPCLDDLLQKFGLGEE